MDLFFSWLGNLAGLVAGCSRYTAVGLSAGALTMLAAPLLHLDPYPAFEVGFCLPLGPLYFWFSSDWVMERRLARLLKWKNDGIISKQDYAREKEEALRWRRERLYGQASPAAPEPAPPTPEPPANPQQPPAGT